MQFAKRIIRLEHENRLLKLAAADHRALKVCYSEYDFLKIMSRRFEVPFSDFWRFLCFNDKVMFSMPGSTYGSSFVIPRDPRQIMFTHDKGMSLALQGKINIQGDFLFFPEKNIEDLVTQIYVLKSSALLKMNLSQKKDLMMQILQRRLSIEEVLMPLYARRWPDEKNEHSIEAFEEELHYFFQKLESFFYVSQIELSFMINAKIKNFKLMNPEWFQESRIVDQSIKKQRLIKIIKTNPLYHHDSSNQVVDIHTLTTRMGAKYWGTLTLFAAYDISKMTLGIPEMKKELEDAINRFSRRASGNLMIIDKQDHLEKVENKSRESYAAARISQLTKLENATAFNEVLMSIFMGDTIPHHAKYLTLTHLDGKALALQNEALSHEVADQIIRKYAESIVSQFQSAYHLSGDEFAVIDTVEDPESFKIKIEKLYETLSGNRIELELTYREFAKILVNTLLYAHKASRSEDVIENYTAEQLWQKVGLVTDKNDPVINEIEKELKMIFKKLSHATPSQENILKEKEYLVHFTESQVKEGLNADQIIEGFVRPEHYQKIETIKQSKRDLKSYVDIQEGVLEKNSYKKVHVSIRIDMTAGSYFLGEHKFNEIKKYFDQADISDVDLDEVYSILRKQTIKRADEVRTEARMRMKNHDIFVDP